VLLAAKSAKFLSSPEMTGLYIAANASLHRDNCLIKTKMNHLKKMVHFFVRFIKVRGVEPDPPQP